MEVRAEMWSSVSEATRISVWKATTLPSRLLSAGIALSKYELCCSGLANPELVLMYMVPEVLRYMHQLCSGLANPESKECHWTSS